MDLLEQIPAVLGDSECHPGRQVALRRWEGWRSTQSASANQCQDQSKRHSGDVVVGAGRKMSGPPVGILPQVLTTSGQFAGMLDTLQICSTLA